MAFAWPYAFVLVALIALLGAFYYLLMRRRRRFAVSFSSLSLLRDAIPRRSGLRRFLPMALFLLGSVSLVVAAARPQAVVEVPRNRTSIILALDVSSSMCANDIEPNRLTVAQDVARTFIETQPTGTRLGLVAFAGLAQLVVAPTTDTGQLVEAIDSLTTSRGTAIGSALLQGVDAIAEINPDVIRSGVDVDPSETGDVAGEYESDIIVLLTDGAATQGVDPIVAAEQAADRRIRVYTIGFGTTEPAQSACSSDQVGAGGGFAGGGFGGGGGAGGFGQFLRLDEETLRTIAELTGGAYHLAEDATQLQEVFAALPTEISLQEEFTEISFLFVALGASAAAASVGLSLLWNRHP